MKVMKFEVAEAVVGGDTKVGDIVRLGRPTDQPGSPGTCWDVRITEVKGADSAKSPSKGVVTSGPYGCVHGGTDYFKFGGEHPVGNIVTW